MAQLEHIEAIEKRLWRAAARRAPLHGVAKTEEGGEDIDARQAAIHEEIAALDRESVALARKIEANFRELLK